MTAAPRATGQQEPTGFHQGLTTGKLARARIPCCVATKNTAPPPGARPGAVSALNPDQREHIHGKFRTSGFPTVRLQATGTSQFGAEPSVEPSRLRPTPPCPVRVPRLLRPSAMPRTEMRLRLRGRNIGCGRATCAQRSSLGTGYVVPPFLAWRPHPPVRRTPVHFPAEPVIGPVLDIQRVILSALLTFRTFTTVLSRIATFSLRRETRCVLLSSSASTLAIG